MLPIEPLFRGMDGDSQIFGSEMSAHMASLFTLAKFAGAGKVVECGVGRGWSTLSLLLGVSEHNGALTSYDREVSTKAAALENFKKVGIDVEGPLLKRWTHIAKLSFDAAADYADGSVSLLFIDTSHTEENTLQELNLWLPKMRPDGIICGHDYWWYSAPGILCGVKAAVDKFASQNSTRVRLQVLRHDNGLFILWPK